MPNGGIPQPVETSAVTVVGLGSGGCRMLGAVADLADDLDPDVALSYVGIDTHPGDLAATAPDDAVTLALEPPRLSRVTVEEWEYLDDDVEQRHAGTARQRRLGRYAVDNPEAFDRTYSFLEMQIHETHERETADGADGAHQIWILHTLGGGTGSGAFPLVTAMIDDVVTGLDGEIAVSALGSLPRLDMLEEQMTRPAGDPRMYLNAYAALRELRVLLGLEEEASFPMRVPVESADQSAQMATDALSLEDPPLAAYGLVGVTESHLVDGTNYRDRVNIVAAGTVLGLGASRVFGPRIGLGRFRTGQASQDRLFSVDGSQVRLPAADFERYAELQSELEDRSEALDRLVDKHSAYEEAIAFLGRVLDHDPLTVDVPELPDVADHLDSLDLSQDLDLTGIENTIGAVAEELIAPDKVDEADVATYLVLKPLDERLSEARSDHQFSAELDALAEYYREALDETDLKARPSDPHAFWSETIQPFLVDRIDAIESELAETMMFQVLERSRLESALEDLQARYEKLERLDREYTHLQDLDDWIDQRLVSAEFALRDRRDELEDHLTESRDRRRAVRDEREQVQSRLDAIEERLRSSASSPFVVEPSVSDPARVAEALAAGTVESLADLEAAGFVSGEELTESIEKALALLDEPVQDRRLTDPDADTLLVHDDGLFDPDGFVHPFEFVLEQPSDEPFVIRFTGLYAPVDLEATSEFGTLHEYYADPARDVSRQFGDGTTDETVRRSFAYPSLLPEGEP